MNLAPQQSSIMNVGSYANANQFDADLQENLKAIYETHRMGMTTYTTQQAPLNGSVWWYKFLASYVIPGAMEAIQILADAEVIDRTQDITRLQVQALKFVEEDIYERAYLGPYQPVLHKVKNAAVTPTKHGMKYGPIPIETMSLEEFTLFMVGYIEHLQYVFEKFVLRELTDAMLSTFPEVIMKRSMKTRTPPKELAIQQASLYNIVRRNPNECIQKILAQAQLSSPDRRGREDFTVIVIGRSVESRIQANSNFWNQNGPHAIANREAAIDSRRQPTSYIGGIQPHIPVEDANLTRTGANGFWFLCKGKMDYKSGDEWYRASAEEALKNAIGFVDNDLTGDAADILGLSDDGSFTVLWEKLSMSKRMKAVEKFAASLPDTVRNGSERDIGLWLIENTVLTRDDVAVVEDGGVDLIETRLLRAKQMDSSDASIIKISEAPHVWLRQLRQVVDLPDHGNKIAMNQVGPSNQAEFTSLLIQATKKKNHTISFSGESSVDDVLKKYLKSATDIAKFQDLSNKAYAKYQPHVYSTQMHLTGHEVDARTAMDEKDHSVAYFSVDTLQPVHKDSLAQMLKFEIGAQDNARFIEGFNGVKRNQARVLISNRVNKRTLNYYLNVLGIDMGVAPLVLQWRVEDSRAIIVTTPKVAKVAIKEEGSFMSLDNNGRIDLCTGFKHGVIVPDEDFGVVFENAEVTAAWTDYKVNFLSPNGSTAQLENVSNTANAISVLVPTGADLPVKMTPDNAPREVRTLIRNTFPDLVGTRKFVAVPQAGRYAPPTSYMMRMCRKMNKGGQWKEWGYAC